VAHVDMDPRWVKEAELATSRPLRGVVEDIADDMRHTVPVDTGELHDSIETEYPRVTVGRVKVGTDHWHETEYGSPPHVIRVRNKKVLHNAETGEFFGKVVHHPGTPEQPFMRPAVYRQRDLA
jgi:hypothetical protein